MDTKDQESQREAATTTEGTTLSQIPQKTRTHGNKQIAVIQMVKRGHSAPSPDED